MVGEKVGLRAVAGVLLGLLGIIVLVEPLRLDWNDRAIIWGHVWLLLAGFTWAIATVHIRRHRWKLAPLDALPWQMRVATVLLWIFALTAEPAGHLELSRKELWMSLLYIGAFAGPIVTWAALSVGRAVPPIVGSMGMLGVPLLSIASSVVLLGETVTAPFAMGTALVISGIAIVIVDRSRD